MEHDILQLSSVGEESRVFQLCRTRLQSEQEKTILLLDIFFYQETTFGICDFGAVEFKVEFSKRLVCNFQRNK